MSHTLEYYMSLPYSVTLTPDRDDQGDLGWFAQVAELPGCMSQGRTPDEAIERVRDAMLGWISVGLEDGKEIPEPRPAEVDFSGRFLTRVPKSLHAALVAAAEQEGVSLNQFVNDALAGAVQWRSRRRVLASGG
ncbi:MAG TPA: type II toxin-antitoxin system HicB family antitoxin [Chloroflexota bacterium]|nr:type II toxin-antitoxin system HicB family antitoxin [Chloroflexota bacterium]